MKHDFFNRAFREGMHKGLAPHEGADVPGILWDFMNLFFVFCGNYEFTLYYY